MAAATSNSLTPLNSTSDNDHFEIVNLLLMSGSDVNCLDINGTFLHLLAFNGYTDLLRLVYEQYHATLHLVEPHGRTLLSLAGRSVHIDTFLYLIILGFNSRTNDAKGDGLLYYASSGGSLQILTAVLDEGAVFSSLSGHLSTIHWACGAGNPNIVERLIKKD